jgi:hypothetical protein
MWSIGGGVHKNVVMRVADLSWAPRPDDSVRDDISAWIIDSLKGTVRVVTEIELEHYLCRAHITGRLQGRTAHWVEAPRRAASREAHSRSTPDGVRVGNRGRILSASGQSHSVVRIPFAGVGWIQVRLYQNAIESIIAKIVGG